MGMTGEYLILDVGTTSVKVSILDRRFRILRHSGAEYKLDTRGSFVEMDPAEYIKAVGQGVCQVLRELKESQAEVNIRGIGITTQGETLIPVDEEGRALDRAIVWLDGRAEQQAARIQAIFPEDVFYEKTGIPQCSGQCPVSKLLWIKEEKPDLYEKTKYFLLLEDYLIHWLTGRFVTEKALMSTTGYFDICGDGLWEEILDRLEIDREKIPEILECGEKVGTILPQRAQMLKLSDTVEIVTGAMDQICSALGAGNCFSGMITETTGTAMCVGATVDESQMHGRMPGGEKIPVYRHCVRGKYMLISVCMTAGMTLKWFKDNFCGEESRVAEEKGISVYEVLDELAEGSRVMSGGVIMIPYLSGSIQPLEASNLRGAFFGIGLENTKADFVRSIMEGVGFMLRENLELLERIMGQKAEEVISLGGGAKGGCWCQIKADISNVPIRSRRQPETTSLGAAVLCAVGLGDYKTVEDALPAIEKEEKIYEPEALTRKCYDKGYERYLEYLSRACGADDQEDGSNGIK